MRFYVTVPVHAAWSGYVEADTPEEAIENFETGYVCAQCSGWGRGDGEAALEVNDDADWDNAEAEQAAP